ncbi:MAG TPA: hypothetical protein VIU11_05330 [Nakamurella sp.]
MRSIIRRTAAGLGAAALGLGLGAAPAFAASPASTSAPTTSVAAQPAGHWQYVATLSSPRSCHNRVLQYALEGVDAQCVDGTKLYIWVDD